MLRWRPCSRSPQALEVRAELTLKDGRHLWAQVTREDARHLGLEQGKVVHVRIGHSKVFDKPVEEAIPKP